MTDFLVTASRAPKLDDAEVKRRLGHVYSLILSYGAKQGTVKQCESAEISEPSVAGDTLVAEPESL